MASTSFAYMALFWTLLATFGGAFGRPAYEVVATSDESREVDETLTTTALPMQNSPFLHMLHPNASELIYGDNETLARQKRCCCCDCCCCCCGGGGGSSEEGRANIGDMIALASLVQSQMQATQQAQAAAAAAQQSPAVQGGAAAGFLPYPLVPRSVNWDNAPKDTASPTPKEKVETVVLAETESDQSKIHTRITPGGECAIDDDCVKGAVCMPQYSWSGVFEKRCVCRPPFLHIGASCVEAPM